MNSVVSEYDQGLTLIKQVLGELGDPIFVKMVERFTRMSQSGDIYERIAGQMGMLGMLAAHKANLETEEIDQEPK